MAAAIKSPSQLPLLVGAKFLAGCSDDDVMEFTFRRARLVRRQRRVVAIERRAIRAHILDVLAHVAEDMRVVLRWQRTHAHEFLSADLDDLNAKVVMEMRNNFVGHVVGTLWQRLWSYHRQGQGSEPDGQAY